MCSLNDDENCESYILPEKPSLSEETTCRSCTNKAFIVLRGKDVYCKDCFLAAETHKFRAALGKSKMMKPQDKVLVAFSGSQSSIALLHLLHSGVTEVQHKKLLFSVMVLFIDEGAVLGLSKTTREEIFESIKEKVSCYNFPLYVASLGECFNESPEINSCLKITDEMDSQIVNLFQNIKSMTSKEDLLYVLRQKLILLGAKHLNCTKIFTAEAGTDLAVKLLCNFSLGRSDQASFETGFCDSRHSNLKILRPLRDFTRKEIVFYNSCYQLEPVNIPSLTTKSSSNISIRKLTEKFVMDLQDGFPSTVYTVFRIGEKLSVSAEEKEGEELVCLLCDDKIRTKSGRNNYSAVKAANFSMNVSRKKSNQCEVNGQESCCGSCGGVSKIPETIEVNELKKFVCYGCSLIIKDLKNVECLPKDLIKSAIQRRDFQAMKAEISEFLLESSPEHEIT